MPILSAAEEKSIRKFVQEMPPETFAIVSDEVQKRLQNSNLPLAEKAMAVINALTTEELTAWIRTAQQRGDTAMLGKLINLAQDLEHERAAGEVTINIVPYTVSDASLASIVKGCDSKHFTDIAEAVDLRRGKHRELLVTQKARSDARKRLREQRKVQIEEA